MSAPKYRLALAYYNGEDGEPNADVFIHTDGADTEREFRQYAKMQYGDDVRLTDIRVYLVNDLFDSKGKVYRASVRKRV